MFGWLRRQRKRDPVVTAEEVRRRLLAARRQQVLSDELDGLRSEAFVRSVAVQVVSAADAYQFCRELCRDQPAVAATLLSLSARAWLNSSRLMNTSEARES